MIKPHRSPRTHRAFEDVEHLGAQVARIYEQSARASSLPRLDTAASFDDLMAASWAFFDQEQARYDTLTFALRVQVEEDMAQRSVEDTVRVCRQSSRAAAADVIDVDAREVDELSDIRPPGAGGPQNAT